MRTENKYDKYAVCWIVFVKLILIAIICSMLVNCSPSSDEAFITITHTDTLEELWGNGGKSAWGTTDGTIYCEQVLEVNHCDIYVMYPEWYGPEYCYNEIIGHETRHAFEGSYHVEGAGKTVISQECSQIASGKIDAWHRDNN